MLELNSHPHQETGKNQPCDAHLAHFHQLQRQVFDDTSTDGGPFSAYTNTTNTILGAGTLAVPIAMSSAGLLSYLLMTAGVISVHSMTATG